MSVTSKASTIWNGSLFEGSGTVGGVDIAGCQPGLTRKQRIPVAR